MRHWFFSTAIVAVATFTLFAFLGFLAFFIVVRHNLKYIIHRVNTQKPSSGARKNKDLVGKRNKK